MTNKTLNAERRNADTLWLKRLKRFFVRRETLIFLLDVLAKAVAVGKAVKDLVR